MENSVFSFKDYRSFIVKKIQAAPGKGRGMKTQLAQFIRCQTTYLSQVLAGKAHFNFEQAEGVTRFFHLEKMEKKYFLVLVQLSRAGTKEARKFLKEELQSLRDQSTNLKERLEVKNILSERERERYYSHWLYSAVHIMVTMPTMKNARQIAQALGLEQNKIVEVLGFLEEIGLVANENGNLNVGTSRLHLGKDSHLLVHHHRNWRMRSLEAIDRGGGENMHYSSVVTASEEDIFKIKSELVEFIKSIKETIKKSAPEEKCYSLNFDFFEVLRTPK